MDKYSGRKILTIGIPTYNSFETLIECLKSLQNQEYYQEDKIEIIISDNGSNYEITSALNEALEKPFFNRIKIFINSDNLGYDANLQRLVQESKGVYLKFLADDDLVTPSFIKHLLILIETESPDLLISNFSFLSKNLEEVIKENWFIPSLLMNEQDRLFHLAATNYAYGQMSSLTFRTQLIRNLSNPKRKSNYIHVYWFLCLLETSIISIEKKSRVIVREGSPNFSGNKIIEIVTPLGGILAIKSSSIRSHYIKRVLVSEQEKYCLSRLTAIDNQTLLARITIFRTFVPYFKYSVKFWMFWGLFILMPNHLRVIFKSLRKKFLEFLY